MLRKLYPTLLIVSLLSISLTTKSHAATFSLYPTAGNYVEGCYYETQVFIDTENQPSNGADILIQYDPSKIEIIDQNTDADGIQITTGDAYESYVYNHVDRLNGNIQIAAGSFISPLDGEKIFATIKFKSKITASSASFNILFDGISNTLDSNIAEKISSTDILTSVTNATYTFSSGECIGDTKSPTISFLYPQDQQLYVNADSQISFNLTDELSGVNIDSLLIHLNGITYQYGHDEINYIGNKSEYSIFLQPKEPIEPEQASQLRIYVRDYAGNVTEKYIIFNIPPGDIGENEAPNIIFIHPHNNGNAKNEDVIKINIYDLKDDLDFNSIRLFFNSVEYTLLSPEITYEGNDKNIEIKLTPINGITQDIRSYLTVYAEDIYHNSNVQAIEFNSGITVFDIETGVSDKTPILFSNTYLPILLIVTGILIALSLLTNPNLIRPNFIKRLLTNKFWENNIWGLILDKRGNVIPYAKVQLFDTGTDTLVAKSYSDKYGRYGFYLSPGKYNLKASTLFKSNTSQEILVDQLSIKNYFTKDIYIELKIQNITIKIFQILKVIPILWLLYILTLMSISFYVFVQFNNYIDLFITLFMITILLLTQSKIINHKKLILTTKKLLPNNILKVFNNNQELIESRLFNHKGLLKLKMESGFYNFCVTEKNKCLNINTIKPFKVGINNTKITL